MRIGFAVTGMHGRGGFEQAAIGLSRALRAQGHRATFLIDPTDLVTREALPELPHELDPCIGDAARGPWARAVRAVRLGRWIVTHRLDAVVTNSTWLPRDLRAVRTVLGRRGGRRLPIVTWFHHHLPVDAAGRYAGSRAVRHADGHLAVSEGMARHLRRTLDTQAVRVVFNVLDLPPLLSGAAGVSPDGRAAEGGGGASSGGSPAGSAASPAPAGSGLGPSADTSIGRAAAEPAPPWAAAAVREVPVEPSNGPLVLAYVGRLVAEKRVDLVLAAAARLAPATRVFVAGAGPERERLEARAAELGLAERLTWAGWTPTPWQSLARSCAPGERPVLCLFSAQESAGMVLIEALARGIPAVATRTDGGESLLEGLDLGAWLLPCPEPLDAGVELLRGLESGRAAPPDFAAVHRKLAEHAPDAVARRFLAAVAELGGLGARRAAGG